ncbi:hypothetical protein KKE60_07950 [Patescibacteria group bacterium]|nr:hypothetical protein [Patescibacteria group bacterium]
MVRPAVYRTSKYSAKMVGDVVKNRFDAQHDSMVEQVTNKFASFVTAENAAKTLLNAAGISTVEIPFYLSFARQCESISTKHSDQVALEELCIRLESWVSRGLDVYYLEQICLVVCGIDLASCTA